MKNEEWTKTTKEGDVENAEQERLLSFTLSLMAELAMVLGIL